MQSSLFTQQVKSIIIMYANASSFEQLWKMIYNYVIYLPSKNMLRVFVFLFSLGQHLQHMEVPCLGVKLKLKLPAYATVTAMPDLSRICSSKQLWIFNPLSRGRD